MTLLTHYRDLPHRPATSRKTVPPTPASATRETAMRGFFRAAVTIMLGTVALAGIIALKAAIYLPHFTG